MSAKTGVDYYSVTLNRAQHVGNTGVCTHIEYAIIDPGDSDIIRSMPTQTGEKWIMQKFPLIKLARAGVLKNK